MNAYHDIKKKDDHILSYIPFNSRRKRASTVIRAVDDMNKAVVYLKGAPEYVLEYCNKIIDEAG